MAAILIFSADWCAPCKDLTLECKRAGIDFEIIDIESDEGQPLADQYGVTEVPIVAARVEGELWRVEDESIANLRRVARAAICDPRTRECALTKDVASELGLQPFDADSDEVDILDLLEQASDLTQLGRILNGTQHTAPRRKAERAERIAQLLIDGELEGADITRHLRRDGLDVFAHALDVDADCAVAELRERVAEAIDDIDFEEVEGDDADDETADDDVMQHVSRAAASTDNAAATLAKVHDLLTLAIHANTLPTESRAALEGALRLCVGAMR